MNFEHIPKIHAGKSYGKKQIFGPFPMFIMCSHNWNLKYSSTVQSDLELASACQEVKEEGSKMPLDFKHIQHMYVYMYIYAMIQLIRFFSQDHLIPRKPFRTHAELKGFV